MSDSELNSNDLLSQLGKRERIKKIGDWYYPQWRIPLTPIWLNFECSYGLPVSFLNLEDALKCFQPEHVEILTGDNEKE